MRRVPALSVIVATLGRPTLGRALDSLRGDAVEVIVVADERDRPLPGVFKLTASHGPRYRAIAHKSERPDWGNSARNAGLGLARGRYVAYLDDDDCWAADVPDWLPGLLGASEGLPVICRMRYSDGRLLWESETLRCGNVGTPMVLLPRDLAQRARWGAGYEADYAYFRDALGAATVRWRPEVLAEIRP